MLCVGARLCLGIMNMRCIMNGGHAMGVVVGVVRDRVRGRGGVVMTGPRWLARMSIRIARIHRLRRLRKLRWVLTEALQREWRRRLSPARGSTVTATAAVTMTVTVAMSVRGRSEIRNLGRCPRRHCLFVANALLNRRLPRRMILGGARRQGLTEPLKLKRGVQATGKQTALLEEHCKKMCFKHFEVETSRDERPSRTLVGST